jgi:hypothetical protein
VEVLYPSTGTGPAEPGDGTGSGGGPQGGGEEVAWGKKVSAAFKAKVIAISSGLGCDPNYLMAAMAFETGASFSPSIRNPHSGATGLIQFLPSTAIGLGTTVGALAQMTAVDQLDVVKKYLNPFQGSMRSLSDVYMTILFPVSVGKPDSFVLFSAPSTRYQQNAGLDVNHDNQVTKGEAASMVQRRLDEGLSAANRG